MHAPWRGGREPRRRAEKRSRSRAESSRVESRRAVAPAHAPLPPTPTRACVLLLARSLARLTRASEERENAGVQRSARSTYATSFTGVETGHPARVRVCLRRGPAGEQSAAVATVVAVRRFEVLPASSQEQRISRAARNSAIFPPTSGFPMVGTAMT